MSQQLTDMMFQPGDSPFAPLFRERLNNLAMIAATLTELKVGDGLLLTFEPGVGMRLELIQLPATPVEDTVTPPIDSDIVWCLVTANLGSAGPNRWTYELTRVRKTAAGYGGWTPITDEEGQPVRIAPAYFAMENANKASGVQGDGVDLDNLDSRFSLKPVPVGDSLVLARPVPLGEGFEWWFWIPMNAIDGKCG